MPTWDPPPPLFFLLISPPRHHPIKMSGGASLLCLPELKMLSCLFVLFVPAVVVSGWRGDGLGGGAGCCAVKPCRTPGWLGSQMLWWFC
jgi:hypothetical protein